MPSTDLGHGDSAARPKRPTRLQDGYSSALGGGEGVGRAGAERKAIPIAADDTKHLLSPLLDTLPALPNLSSLRTFLPNSPPPQASGRKSPSATSSTVSRWQSADLRDGRGRQNLLLISAPDCALRVLSIAPSNIPADPQAVEEVPAPEEIFSLVELKRDANTRMSQLGGVEANGTGQEAVVFAQIVDRGDLVEEYGPLALILRGEAAFALVIVALRTGLAVREVAVGSGRAASVQYSARAIAIGIADRLHLLHPSTLESFHSVTILPTTPFSISGRLLAFATDDPPRSTGSSGLGTLITARSIPHSRVASEGAARPLSPSSTSAIASSAVSIGGGVARTVWAGIRMGAQAAHQANASRLARSAPTASLLGEEESLSGSRSIDDFPAEGVGGAGWIKVLDLGRLPQAEVASPYTSSKAVPLEIKTVAHFRLPHPNDLGQHTFRPNVTTLSWNADGTQLLAAPLGGREFHIFQLHPSPRSGSGAVLHLYELKRGNTAAQVAEVVWDQSGRWVGVATDRGTIRELGLESADVDIYPIHPSGAPASSITHSTSKLANPDKLHPLSQIVDASARLRSATDQPASFALARWQLHPLDGGFCQDISIFRPSLQVIELQRLSIKQQTQSGKKGSGISEVIRLKGLGDLEVEHGVQARWRLPGTGADVGVGSAGGSRANHLPPLANAEIRTYSANPRILPSSVYLSHQIDFYSARSEDSPSSITSPRARQRQLHYRNEVKVKSSTASFDEPLSTALHTRIESPTHGEIPGLPNVLPNTKWRSIPIRTVAGVGEGLDRVRQTYVKAQAIRRHRRASELLSNGLSFEEGAIFASSPNGLGLDLEDSSPASEGMPVSESALADEDDGEWAEGWEDEYRRAVDIEGEPDDLVLGLMDEEEDERRRSTQNRGEGMEAKGKGR